MSTYQSNFAKLAEKHGVTPTELGFNQTVEMEGKEFPFDSVMAMFIHMPELEPSREHYLRLAHILDQRGIAHGIQTNEDTETLRHLLTRKQSDTIKVNLSPVYAFAKTHGLSISALAGELEVPASSISKFTKTQAITYNRLTRILLEIKNSTPSDAEDDFNQAVRQCLNREKVKLTRGAAGRSKIYDFSPVKELLISHRYTVSSWAQAARMTRSAFYGLVGGPVPMTPERFDRVLESAHELAPQLSKELRKLEDDLGPI